MPHFITIDTAAREYGVERDDLFELIYDYKLPLYIHVHQMSVRFVLKSDGEASGKRYSFQLDSRRRYTLTPYRENAIEIFHLDRKTLSCWVRVDPEDAIKLAKGADVTLSYFWPAIWPDEEEGIGILFTDVGPTLDWDSARLLRDDLKSSEIQAELRDRGAKQPQWPWGNHETENLRWLSKAAHRFWARFDPSDESTASTNEEVVGWLQTESARQGSRMSDHIAKAIATILRPEGLKPGRKRT
jgi:hypothetical protein